jgi:hypothetical protein
MAVNIKLKRSGVSGRIPTTSSLELGEIALNTYDGKAFFKKQVGSVETIIELASTSGSAVVSASHADNADFAVTASFATNANFANSASQASNANTATSASYAATATSASYAGTASFVNLAISASYANSASYAVYGQTSSYATNFNVSGNLDVGGTITAQRLVVQIVTSSQELITGSLIVSGTLDVYGAATINNLTGSLYGTASWAISSSYNQSSSYANSASYSATAISASYAGASTSASYSTSASFAVYTQTSSHAEYTITSSYASASTSASYANSASYSATAISASYANSASYSATAISSSYALAATSASYAWEATSASHASTSTSASYANSASYAALAITASHALMATSASYASASTSASYANSSSYATNAISSSYAFQATSASYGYSSSFAQYAQRADTASVAPIYLTTGAFNSWTGSYTTGSFIGSFTGSLSGSVLGTSSFATSASYANSASYAAIAITASSALSASQAFSSSYALTASYLEGYVSPFPYTGSAQITGSLGVTGSVGIIGEPGTLFSADIDIISFTGSFLQTGSMTVNGDITSTGTITAQRLVVQTITSSVDFVTGSTKFGSLLSNTHEFTGSVSITSSLTVNGSPVITASQTGSMSVASASYAQSASYANSASFAVFTQTSSHAEYTISSSYASASTSASYALNATTASYANVATSASYALDATSASYAVNATSASYAAIAISASYAESASYANSSSYAAIAITASSAISASLAQSAISTSYASNADLLDGKDSSTFATTGSNIFVGTQTVTGSFLVSGSTTQVGNNTLLGNTTLSGSVTISGSANANANFTLQGHLRLDPGQDPGPNNYTASYLFTSGSNTATGYDLYYRQDGNLVKFKWLEGGLSTGMLYGGGISYSGSTIYVKAGAGIINNMNASTGSEINPILTYVTWNDYTASAQYLTSSQNTYLYVDASGSIFQQTSFFNQTQYEQALPLGRVTHPNFTSITGYGSNVQTTYDGDTQQNDFIRAFGPLKVSGFSITPQTGSLRLGIGSGTAFNLGGFYTQDPNSPSHYDSAGFATASIARAYRSGSDVYLDNNGGAFYTTVDPDYWDDGTGVLNTMSAGDWQIQRVFINPVTGRTVVYYGQHVYSNLVNALQYLATDSFVEGEFTAKSLIFAGYLILKGQTNNLTDTTNNRVINAGIFRNIAGGSSGGGAVAQTLNDLSDVIITTPTNYQALVYDGGNWINGTPASSSFSAHATTASSADDFTVRGTLTAQTLVVQVITSSVELITGSLIVSGALDAYGGVTGSLLGTASFANSASNANTANNTISASFAQTAISASYASNVPATASFAISASQAFSSSYALTASFALNGGGGGISAIYIADEGTLQGTASYFDFTGAGVTATVSSGTASINIPGGGGTAGGAQTFTQSVAANTWSFSHGINSRTPIVEVYDSTYNVILPTAIYNSGPYNTNIYFDVAQSGYAVISTGGVLAVSGANAVLNQTAAATTWSFNHDLHTTYPVFTIYDSNDDVIIPQRIHAVDTGSAEIYFSTPRTGKAIASVGGNISFTSSSLSSSYATTASYANVATSASFADSAISASYALNATSASYALNATSASWITGSNVIGVVSNATSASYALSSSFAYQAQTASSADNLTVRGTITAQTLVVQTITSSIDLVTGSLIVSGTLNAYGGITGSLLGTASFANSSSNADTANSASLAQQAISSSYSLVATSASYALNATSASWITGSNVVGVVSNSTSASYALTASYASNVPATSSFAISASQANSASYALTASYSLSGTGFPFSGSAVITGSLLVSGSGITGSLFGTSSFALAFPDQGYPFTQSVAATTWSIAHNLNAPTPLINVYNSSYYQVIPAEIVAVNANNIELRFATPISGYALVSKGSGITAQNALTASFATTASFAQTASYVANAQTASYVLNAVSASYALNAVTSSYALVATSASYAATATSASYAATASYINPITDSYVVLTQVSQSLNFADDAAAAAGGVPLGGLYRNGNFILIRIS